MKKKSVIAVLTFWSFVHFVLFMFGGSFGDRYKKFFPFTYKMVYFGSGDWEITQYFDVSYYDIIELTAYVGGAWLIFFLFYYLKNKMVIAILIFWSFVHFILLMLGSQFLSNKDEFYPFNGTAHKNYGSSGSYYNIEEFFDVSSYDPTEFTIYVGGAWLIYFLYYYINNEKKE